MVTEASNHMYDTHIVSHKKYNMTDQADCDTFATLLNDVPLPPWHVGHDHHKKAADAAIMHCMKKSFPLNAKVKRKPYLTENTWWYIRYNTHLKAAARYYKVTIRTLAALAVSVPLDTGVGAHFAHAIKTVSSHIRYLSKIDLGNNCQDCVTKMHAEKKANHARIAWNHFRTLAALGGSKKFISKRPLPLLFDHQGMPTVDEQSTAAVFLKSFADIEKATLSTHTHTVDNYNAAVKTKRLPASPSIVYVQPLRGTIQSIHISSEHRASGPDGIGNGLLKKAPCAVARHYDPLLVKTQLTAVEPFEFKGSIAHPLLKAIDKDAARVLR